jgi:hypothetical protein
MEVTGGVMTKYTFKKECADVGSYPASIEMVVEAITHDELMSHFTDFLRGCGFIIDYDMPCDACQSVQEDNIENN